MLCAIWYHIVWYQILEGGVTSFRGGGGAVVTKKKLKSEIFNDKKSLKAKIFFSVTTKNSN